MSQAFAYPKGMMTHDAEEVEALLRGIRGAKKRGKPDMQLRIPRMVYLYGGNLLKNAFWKKEDLVEDDDQAEAPLECDLEIRRSR